MYVLYLLSQSAMAQTESAVVDFLTPQPNKCVALTQGRQCFTKVTLRWRMKSAGDYCLLLETAAGDNPPLQCWLSAKQGEFLYDMQADEDIIFVLRQKNQNKALIRSVVQVSWLYKSNSRKRRWRLF